MSFLIKPAENVIIKRNSIKFDDRFKVSYHNFYRQKKYEHIREILSKDIFFERIAFQISHAISYPHIENPFADKVSQLLYADIIDIFEFPNKHSLPKILRDIELDQQIYDIRAFEDLNLLKYKLFNNHFSANVSLCDDLFLEFMKRPNTLWKETKDL